MEEAIKAKRIVLSQAVDCLFHIQFEPERGLILDQLTSVMDDGSSKVSDLSHMTLEKVYKNGAQGGPKSKEDVKKLKNQN